MKAAPWDASSLDSADGLMGRCKWTRKITDVVKRLARERLSHEPRGGRICPEHENPGVMVLHGEPPVVFGPFHFPRILGVEDEAPGTVTGAWQRPISEVGCLARVDALPDELRGRLTMIVSNPPYVAASELPDLPPEVAQHEPHTALISGPSGLEALSHPIAEAPGWLTTPGGLVCELAPHQAEAACAQATGFSEVFVRDDLTGRPRVLVARLG